MPKEHHHLDQWSQNHMCVSPVNHTTLLTRAAPAYLLFLVFSRVLVGELAETQIPSMTQIVVVAPAALYYSTNSVVYMNAHAIL